jgi:hypothetical protein
MAVKESGQVDNTLFQRIHQHGQSATDLLLQPGGADCQAARQGAELLRRTELGLLGLAV